MKIRDIMTQPVIRISPEETASVAAQMLTHYNIGALPVCGNDGRIWGILTDRDIVTRCLATGCQTGTTKVGQIMSKDVSTIRPDMDVHTAALLMAGNGIRRLPVMENGKLCGMVSLGDLMFRRWGSAENREALKPLQNAPFGQE